MSFLAWFGVGLVGGFMLVAAVFTGWLVWDVWVADE